MNPRLNFRERYRQLPLSLDFVPRFVILVFAMSMGIICTSEECNAQYIPPGSKKIPLPGKTFHLDGHDGFEITPQDPATGSPWIWYAPTLPGLPADSEVWMFKRFLDQGIAIAGIDVGESYGSPDGRQLYSRFYDHMTQSGFNTKPVLLARSRGGLMLYNWAVENPQSVSGIAGIYPVCDLTSYPGIKRAAGAYKLTPQALAQQLKQNNPVERLLPLAKAQVPIFHLHGDIDRIVPLEDNSGRLQQCYSRLGGPIEVEVIRQQGHNMWLGWFRSEKLVDFAVTRALGKPWNGNNHSTTTPTPIAHWAFEGKGNTAQDSTGGGNHGKIQGAAQVNGKIGKARRFSRARGDHIEVPFRPSLQLSTFTVAAWVQLTKEPTFSGILGTRFGGDYTFDMKVNADKVHGDIGNGRQWLDTKINFYATDTGSDRIGGDLQVGKWYHVVYVVDAEQEVCRLYLNADLKKKIPFSGKPLLMTPKQKLRIGESSPGEFMDGVIDEVKIWNLALTGEQVREEVGIK